MSGLSDENFEYSFGSLFITLPKATFGRGSWTDLHARQGFSRGPGTIQLSTLTQFGSAKLTVHLQDYNEQSKFERVIEIPFEIPKGKLEIGSIERVDDPLVIEVEPGYYKVVVAQSLLAEDESGAGRELIDIYLGKLEYPIIKSKILVCDAGLDPLEALVENY